MKRIIALVLIMIMTVPVLSFAEDEHSFKGESITIKAPSEWDFDNEWTFAEIESAYYFDDYIASEVFAASHEDVRLTLYCIRDEVEYTGEETSLTYDELKSRYMKKDGIQDMIFDFIFEHEDTFPDYTNNAVFSVEGNLKCGEKEYIKVRIYSEKKAFEDDWMYISNPYEGAYEVFHVDGDKSEKISEEELECAESIISSYENDGYFEYMSDEWFYEDWDNDDDSDMGYIFFIIIGIAAWIIGKGILGKKDEDDEENEENYIYVEDREEENCESDEEEKPSPVSLNENVYDAEPVTYRSSASYESSLKDMLDSGIITKKEYKELLRKHGK